MKFQHALALIALCVLPACDHAAKEKSRKAAIEEIQAAAQAVKEKSLQDIENGTMSVDQEFDYSGINDALDKAEKLTEGQDKIAIQLSKIYVARFSEISKRLTDAGSDLAQGVDYSMVTTEEDLNALSTKVRNYRKVNMEVRDAMNMGLIEELERDADRMGLVGNSKKEFFAEITGQFTKQLPLLHEIRDIDDQLCEVILAQHDILRDYVGEWAWSEEIENIEFSNDDALQGFNEKAVEIQKLAVDQASSQKQLLNIR